MICVDLPFLLAPPLTLRACTLSADLHTARTAPAGLRIDEHRLLTPPLHRLGRATHPGLGGGAFLRIAQLQHSCISSIICCLFLLVILLLDLQAFPPGTVAATYSAGTRTPELNMAAKTRLHLFTQLAGEHLQVHEMEISLKTHSLSTLACSRSGGRSCKS